METRAKIKDMLLGHNESAKACSTKNFWNQVKKVAPKNTWIMSEKESLQKMNEEIKKERKKKYLNLKSNDAIYKNLFLDWIKMKRKNYKKKLLWIVIHRITVIIKFWRRENVWRISMSPWTVLEELKTGRDSQRNPPRSEIANNGGSKFHAVN